MNISININKIEMEKKKKHDGARQRRVRTAKLALPCSISFPSAFCGVAVQPSTTDGKGGDHGSVLAHSCAAFLSRALSLGVPCPFSFPSAFCVICRAYQRSRASSDRRTAQLRCRPAGGRQTKWARHSPFFP